MVAPIFMRGGSRSWTGSRLVLGGLLALTVIFGMLTMHSLQLEGPAGVHGSPAGQSSTADNLTTWGLRPPVVVAEMQHGQTVSAGMSCANCSPGDAAMAASCLAAVALALLLLLPRRHRVSQALPELRAGPRRDAMEPILRRAPSLKVLCINRC